MFSTRAFVRYTLLVFAVAMAVSLAHTAGSGLGLLKNALKAALKGEAGTDSTDYMNRAWAAFEAGKPVYETIFFAGKGKFLYPMSSLLLYRAAMLVHVSGASAVTALVLVSYLANLLFGGEVLLAAIPGSETMSRSTRLLLRGAVVLLGLCFFPLGYGLWLGQIQLFLDLMWTFALLLWMRGKPEWSGVCVAGICVFKPQFAVFLVWACLRRHWRFLLPLLGCMVATQLVTIAVFGWHNEVEYLAVVSYLSRHGEAIFPNASVNGVLHRVFHNGDTLHWSPTVYPEYNRWVYLGTVISTAALLGAGLLVPAWRRWRNSSLDLLFFGLLATIASPIVWEHHYGYFFAAALFVTPLLTRFDRGIQIAFGALYLLLSLALPGMSSLAATRWNVLVSYELFAGLGLLVLMAVIAERTPPDRLGRAETLGFPARAPAEVPLTS